MKIRRESVQTRREMGTRRREALSNCLDNYASCTTFGCQGVPVGTIALSLVSSFRIAATNATFGALPAVRKRW